MSNPGDPAHDDASGVDLIAAEYVVGVLDAPARRDAERRMAAEPAFAAEIGAWEARLMPIVDRIVPVPPPPGLWARIARRIQGQGSQAVVRSAEARPGLWNSLGFWRGLSAVSLAAAAASVAVLIAAPPKPVAGAVSVAVLGPKGGPAAFFVSFDTTTERLVVAPASATARNGTPQLWLMPPGGPPRSIGLLSSDRPLTISAPGGLAIGRGGAALGVSLEPTGGSPTGLPTGPVIAQGTLQAL